jgi:dolichyl-phosphate beta-glucosyltransferase
LDHDIALVIPTYNERERLPRALDELSRFLQREGLTGQIIVADDGSTDGTPGIARRWIESRRDGGLTVELVEIDHRGKGAAVRAGMNRAEAPVVGYLDTDLSAGPDAVERVYRAIKDGADVAMGSRGLPESVLPVRQPWYRERAGRTFNVILRKLSRLPYRDTQCGLKLFRYEAATQIFRHQRLDGFAFDAEAVVLALKLGYTVEEIPIVWSHAEGSRVSLVRDSLRMGRDILRIVRRLGRTPVHPPGVPTERAMDRMVTSEDVHWWHVAKRSLVTGILAAEGADGPCLDVGCGGGATALRLAERMPTFGVDLSSQALGHARSRGLTGLVRAEGSALPFGEGSFGSALALDVVEHHARPEQLLGEVKRALRPGGTLVVTVPAFQWMWSYADHVLGHYRRYTRPGLAADLLSAGFELERVTYFHSWLLPMAWVFRQLKALVGKTQTADDFLPPRYLNGLLLRISRVELGHLRRGGKLPFGLSVLAVCRRPAADGQAAGSSGQRRRSRFSMVRTRQRRRNRFRSNVRTSETRIDVPSGK